MRLLFPSSMCFLRSVFVPEPVDSHRSSHNWGGPYWRGGRGYKEGVDSGGETRTMTPSHPHRHPILVSVATNITLIEPHTCRLSTTP